ncbi:MAG: hypothetical protein ACTSR8_05300 [Promethearchaeota archaeon]
MSVRFQKFAERVGKNNAFKPLKNALMIYLIEEAERKYKNYPRLLNKMKRHWPEYKDRSRISHLLKDHYEEIFGFWLTTIFPFRPVGLDLSDPEAPTPVDFKLVYKYTYSTEEIQIIQKIIDKLEIKNSLGEPEKVEGVLKRLFIFTISSFAPMVEQIFERPFAFQFSNIDGVALDNGEYEVIAIMSAREQ